jgi:hypothetical protein
MLRTNVVEGNKRRISNSKHFPFKSLTITQTGYTGKHATNRKIQFIKINLGSYPYSQKYISLDVLSSNGHIEVLRDFLVLHINIPRSAYIFILARHTEDNMKVFQLLYSNNT